MVAASILPFLHHASAGPKLGTSVGARLFRKGYGGLVARGGYFLRRFEAARYLAQYIQSVEAHRPPPEDASN